MYSLDGEKNAERLTVRHKGQGDDRGNGTVQALPISLFHLSESRCHEHAVYKYKLSLGGV